LPGDGWALLELTNALVNTKYPNFQPLKEGLRDKGLAWNRHGYYIVLTLIIRLAGVDGPWLRQK